MFHSLLIGNSVLKSYLKACVLLLESSYVIMDYILIIYMGEDISICGYIGR